MIDRRLVTNFDWTLLGIVMAICLLGVLNIYSASAPTNWWVRPIISSS